MIQATRGVDRRIAPRAAVEGTWGEGRQGLLARLGLGMRFRLKVLDLSETGMRVVACHPLPAHSRYTFMVEGGTKRGTRAITGQVVWSEELRQERPDVTLHGFLAGVEFRAPRERDRAFLRDLAEHRKPRADKTTWKH